MTRQINKDLTRGWAVIPFVLMPHFYIDMSDKYRGFKIMEGYDRYYVSLCGKAAAGTNKTRMPTEPGAMPKCRLCRAKLWDSNKLRVVK